MFNNRSGFTLIEIMIVVGVVVIVLTLALPSMLRSRMNANELAAIANCRLIYNACQSYYGDAIPHTYPDELEDLTEPTSIPSYIDTSLASGERQGYCFIYRLRNPEMFILRVNPISTGRTGQRYFFVDETGVIRASTEGPADATDPEVSG